MNDSFSVCSAMFIIYMYDSNVLVVHGENTKKIHRREGACIYVIEIDIDFNLIFSPYIVRLY